MEYRLDSILDLEIHNQLHEDNLLARKHQLVEE
jgi:hypothetical protein